MADKWANAKSNQKSVQKLTKIIENGVLDHPGGSRGRLGDQFGPRAAQGSKRAAKQYSVFGTKMETWSNFPWFFFSVF